jgi:hypothetical protein
MYRRNHYVPIWFQKAFLPKTGERKCFYLDLNPELIVHRDGVKRERKSVNKWGPPSCFFEMDLYTTWFGREYSTEIEEKFFGPKDAQGREAVAAFQEFSHTETNPKLFQKLVEYMSLQKLRTPKGLNVLKDGLSAAHPNALLIEMQRYTQMFCATWSECVWSIADASRSQVKFILSDHPVTVFNRWAYPGSPECQGIFDPDIRQVGTHTLFPISGDKILILTNLGWVRNSYQPPLNVRLNPRLFRQTVVSLLGIQIGRTLLDEDVHKINFIIKQRAHRYIAAEREDWLYPEEHFSFTGWDRLSENDFLMPDPRAVSFSSEIVLGMSSGRSFRFDEYGRTPGLNSDAEAKRAEEMETFQRYQSEYAARHGRKRRGRSFEFGGLSAEEESEEMHRWGLGRLDRSGTDTA